MCECNIDKEINLFKKYFPELDKYFWCLQIGKDIVSIAETASECLDNFTKGEI